MRAGQTVRGSVAVAVTSVMLIGAGGFAGAAEVRERASTPSVVLPASVGAIDSSCTGTVLRQGSSGRCVRILQNAMNYLFNANLVADGVFGPATTGWVRGVQARYGLAQDGVVGAATWSQLQWCEMRFLNGLSY